MISVKDFKAIVTHAGITHTIVSAAYSHPSKPMQLRYGDEGMMSEFILMTTGDHRSGSITPAPAVGRSNSSRPAGRMSLEALSNRNGPASTLFMPPPPRSAAPSIARESVRNRVSRPSPPPPQPSLDSNALFLPEDDEDRKWDPSLYGDEDAEMLGWDASADNVSIHNIFLMIYQAEKVSGQ